MGTRVNALDPKVVASVLGVTLVEVESLGTMGGSDWPSECAGRLDRNARRIEISRQFPAAERRFTAAHELAHWVLHDKPTMHRDRPLGVQARMPYKPLPEREADHFAACLLMPRGLVQESFIRRFGPTPFELDDNRAWQLSGNKPDYVLAMSREELAFFMANFTHHKDCPVSLIEEYGVSQTAMARRLIKLDLVR